MIRNIALTLAVVIASHMCLASPVPEPFGGHSHRTHVKIHVPYHIRTVYHHHIEKVPVIKPVIKEVPIYHEVPIVKTVPVVQHVPVPVVNTVHVEKPLFVPVPIKEHHHPYYY